MRDFTDLIEAMDSFMKENIATVTEVTRTRMIVAYYYYYGVYMAYENSTDWRDFEEIFNNFKTEVDEYLEASGYQALDGKNLFDVLIVFSAYARINYTPEGTL
jgi:hypothetical protein